MQLQLDPDFDLSSDATDVLVITALDHNLRINPGIIGVYFGGELWDFGNKHDIFTNDRTPYIKKRYVGRGYLKNPIWMPVSRWPPFR